MSLLCIPVTSHCAYQWRHTGEIISSHRDLYDFNQVIDSLDKLDLKTFSHIHCDWIDLIVMLFTSTMLCIQGDEHVIMTCWCWDGNEKTLII